MNKVKSCKVGHLDKIPGMYSLTLNDSMSNPINPSAGSFYNPPGKKYSMSISEIKGEVIK
jgi:hypothetical protein